MHTILLVEDDAPAIVLIEAVLEPHADWRLIVARSGDEAIDIAVREHPDVVLLDVVLPSMDGIEICRRLKSDPATANAHVVFLTAVSKQATEAEAWAAGADEYLLKPFSTVKLVETIELKLAAT